MKFSEETKKTLKQISTLDWASSIASGVTVVGVVASSTFATPIGMAIVAGGAAVAATTKLAASRKRTRASKKKPIKQTFSVYSAVSTDTSAT